MCKVKKISVEEVGSQMPNAVLKNVCLIRGHPYITSAKGLGGWVKKKARFADVQYCIYADKVGGWGPKRQKYADVI